MADIRENKSAKKNPYWFQVMVNGKRVTRRGFRTKGDARKALAEVVTELSSDTYIEPNRMTYGDYFVKWLEGRRNIAYSTRQMYDSYFRTHIDPFLGKYQLSKITALIIDDFVNELRGKGLSSEMVKRVYSVVSASLNNAVKKELIPRNVANNIEKPRVKRDERKVWSVAGMTDFLAKSRGESRYWIAVFMAVMTGMRQGEILALKWEDIDFDRKVIHVKRNLQKDGTNFSDLKTEKSRRVISVSEDVLGILREQRHKQRLERVSLGVAYQNNDLVVCSSKGTPARATKVLHAWNVMCEKFKDPSEPDMTFHDLRHMHATIALTSGAVSITEVSRRLGHSNVTTTLNTYSHLLPTQQEKLAEVFDKLISFDVEKEDKRDA